jgi:hypothetical protein
MPGAKVRGASPNAKLPFPLSADYQISNRNIPEFRISPNSNKTQRILISNRNNNPHFPPNVAIGSSSRSRRLTLTNAEPHSPSSPFLITDPRLETTPKHQKTKARDDF